MGGVIRVVGLVIGGDIIIKLDSVCVCGWERFDVGNLFFFRL